MIGTKTPRALLVFIASLFVALIMTMPLRSAEGQATSNPTPPESLSYEVFKTKVQPIFLKNRAEHARCYGCHILPNRIFHLEPLSPGSPDWNYEPPCKNFQSALEAVNLEEPASSKLLLHPLAPEAGGDPFHSGGRQFASQNDP